MIDENAAFVCYNATFIWQFISTSVVMLHTSASFALIARAFSHSIHGARRYASLSVSTERALILCDVATKVLVKCLIVTVSDVHIKPEKGSPYGNTLMKMHRITDLVVSLN